MMICKQCKHPMVSAEGGKVQVCLFCGKTVDLPMAGATTQHKLTSRVQTIPAPQPAELEVSFAEIWRDFHPSLPFETEYFFSLTRDWRLDFAWAEAKVAVEFEGVHHQKKYDRYTRDVAKYNALAYDGWLLFRCTKLMLEKDAERFCRMVAETIRKRLSGGSKQASSSSE